VSWSDPMTPMTLVSGLAAERHPGRPTTSQRNTGSFGRWTKLASHLLIGLAVGCAGCLPPEFEVAEEVNEPVTLDRSALAVPPTHHPVTGCPPVATEIDVENAIGNPDDDPLFILWFFNFEGLPGEGYARIGDSSFVFDPCTQPNVREGGLNPNKVEVFIFDRSPRSISQQGGEDSRVSDVPDATFVTDEWFFAVEDLTCCAGGGN
jgi:hypothetical protein